METQPSSGVHNMVNNQHSNPAEARPGLHTRNLHYKKQNQNTLSNSKFTSKQHVH